MIRDMERKKCGRPNLGPRREYKVRAPTPLSEALEIKAADRAMTVPEYLLHLAAQDTGVPARNQGVLTTA